jgi:hypothetical protein
MYFAFALPQHKVDRSKATVPMTLLFAREINPSSSVTIGIQAIRIKN